MVKSAFDFQWFLLLYSVPERESSIESLRNLAGDSDMPYIERITAPYDHFICYSAVQGFSSNYN